MSLGHAARVGWLALAAANGALGQEASIKVGLDNTAIVPAALLSRAEETAARIYAAIDVKIEWCNCEGTEISMQFDAGLQPMSHPGAIGYALPYAKGGTRIHVLFGRVQFTGSRWFQAALLGHVMAHELGHVLEGFSGHSESGVMKAHWDNGDYAQMMRRPLVFSALDAEWVRAGLRRLGAH